MNDTHSLSHTKWNCKYHIVFVVKYFMKTMKGKYEIYLKNKKDELGERLILNKLVLFVNIK